MARPAALYYCATSAFVPHDFIQISADFCWDPLGLSRPRFWDLDAVMWTEPSTGFAAPARELIALCHDMFDIFLEGVPRAEFSDLTHHIATAILHANRVLWQHFSGRPRATVPELQAAYDGLAACEDFIPVDLDDLEDADC